MHWHLLTGEFPPEPGGVADYAAQVAEGLARAGETVHVWAPAVAGRKVGESCPFHLHELPGRFGPRALRALDRELDRLARPRRLLVQYVPHAFGWKAMNLGFAHWLWRRRHRETIWVMFHEVAFPRRAGAPLRHRLLAAVTARMAAMVAGAAEERVFVAIPGWGTFLEAILGRPIPWTALPVPSNLPTCIPGGTRDRVRDALGIGPTGLIVGHFGTYAPAVCRLLEGPLTAWLRALPHALGLLLGQGGDTLAAELHQLYPDLAGRFLALGPQSAAALAAHLAACDLLIQPYPDGACGRRGSLMAGLALGRAILTTRGRFTEPIWEASGAVALADENATALQAVGAALLADPARRRLLGERAAALYERAFRLECTVARLLS